MAKELKKDVSPISLKDTLSAEDEKEKLGGRGLVTELRKLFVCSNRKSKQTLWMGLRDHR